LNYTRNGYDFYSFVAAIILLSFAIIVNPFLKMLFE